MNPEPVLAWLKQVGGALTRALSPTQLLSLGVTFAAVVGLIVGAAYWITTPSYRVLFAGLDPESAASVVEELQANEVDYRLDSGGRTVRVPGPELDELRLHFASQGLPASGRIGFEIFDRTAFGATEFLEQVNFRRALEGEIARTISALAEIDGARVHIALPQQAVFGRTGRAATASVVLRLRHRQALAPSTSRGIANLVAASVEGLAPDAVVLMDSFGRLLDPTADTPPDESGRQAERRHELEQALSQRVVALLEPVAGVGRVRANVAVVLQTASEEATEETWDPTTAVARSRHVSGDEATLDATSPGVAGAQANRPPPAPTPAAGGAAPAAGPAVAARSSTRGRRSETTNYEISKSVRHIVRPAGDIARLSVAVILDDRLVVEAAPAPEPAAPPETEAPDADTDADVAAADAPAPPTATARLEPRAPEDLEKIRGLVAAALGVDPARGDLLTVENIPFETTPPPELVTPPVWQPYLPQLLEAARIGAALLLTLVLFQLGLRPLIRRVTALREAVAAPGAGTPAALAGAAGPALEEVSQQGKIEALATHATTLSHREPETAARLVRAWLEEEGRAR